jgi:hypothetical protein
MAYDWSGNTVKEKRENWLVVAVVTILALLLITAMTPLGTTNVAAPKLVDSTAKAVKSTPLKL